MSPAAAACIAEATRLRKLSLSPIPIVRRIGYCPISYGQFRECGMPAEVFEEIVRTKHAHGIQCFTSAGWDNVTIDVDGRRP